MLGICNGFQVLCEAGLLPGRAAPQRPPALPLPAGRGRRRERRHRLHARVRARGAALDSRQAHDRPLLRAARAARRAGGERAGRLPLRAGPEPERLAERHRRRVQRGGQRRRADAAPRARGRPARSARPTAASCSSPPRWSRAAGVSAPWPSTPPPRARPDRRRVRPDLREARPRAERPRAGGLLADVVGALRLQALEEAAPAAADRGAARRDGPGRERRRRRRGRRAGGRVQGRVAQPPERGRAVPGRGHRRRRDPARRLRDRRAADRDPRLAALRRARLGPLALPARPRGRGHRPLRQLDRRRDGRRRDLLRGALRAELPRQRDVPGHRAEGAADPQRRRGRGQPARAVRRAHRPRRHRRRVGARQRRARRGRRTSARASRSATRSRRRSCSSARSSCSTRACSRRCRTSARRG